MLHETCMLHETYMTCLEPRIGRHSGQHSVTQQKCTNRQAGLSANETHERQQNAQAAGRPERQQAGLNANPSI